MKLENEEINEFNFKKTFLQHVNYTFVEFHPSSFKPSEKRNVRLVEVSRITNWLNDVTQELGLKSQIHVDNFDDESFFD